MPVYEKRMLATVCAEFIIYDNLFLNIERKEEIVFHSFSSCYVQAKKNWIKSTCGSFLSGKSLSSLVGV